jgi:hypothetical protein
MLRWFVEGVAVKRVHAWSYAKDFTAVENGNVNEVSKESSPLRMQASLGLCRVGSRGERAASIPTPDDFRDWPDAPVLLRPDPRLSYIHIDPAAVEGGRVLSNCFRFYSTSFILPRPPAPPPSILPSTSKGPLFP